MLASANIFSLTIYAQVEVYMLKKLLKAIEVRQTEVFDQAKWELVEAELKLEEVEQSTEFMGPIQAVLLVYPDKEKNDLMLKIFIAIAIQQRKLLLCSILECIDSTENFPELLGELNEVVKIAWASTDEEFKILSVMRLVDAQA